MVRISEPNRGNTLLNCALASPAIVVDGTTFALNGTNVSYRFHVEQSTRDLISDHFGGSITEPLPVDPAPIVNGWTGMADRVRREFPDHGRGDFRTPAFRILQADGHGVSTLEYQSHAVMNGKPALSGLPMTFGNEEDVRTLVVHLYDKHSAVAADLMYSVFPKYDAIVRSVTLTNKGSRSIMVEDLASFSVDLPLEDLEMIGLRGEWAREAHRQRRRVDYGIQGYVVPPTLAVPWMMHPGIPY